MVEAGTQAEGSEQPARRWSFGPAVLDERTLELVVNGGAVSVERKPLEVLLFLLRHAGEVVTKDEILEAVWPGRILSETVLTKAIARVREALGDDAQTVIKTQHGYGYRLIAAVKVETSTAAPPPRFGFGPGDTPPLRPNWKLERRLGTGGHGEAWLARQEKTREARVFKFALDSTALASLKREITIFRLLHEALPERTDFVQILDWNLEEPPYFLESEDAGLDLVQWAEVRGGLDRIPLALRLEIATKIADALAAAHSVGVLHKDLKPSNVLIATEGDLVHIRLSDFGSGGVVDPERLEALGITRLGFTRTLAMGSSTGTPIYFAPEIIAGQPFTVQADIYALGVMLYQLVAGDLRKPLAPGWERAVGDDLLREDIADAAAGDAAARIAEVSVLAQRIRTLEQRRQQRDAEQAQAREAQRLRQTLERMVIRRTWARLAIGALALGLAASSVLLVLLYRAQERAAAAIETSKAVSEFLSRDMFGAISSGQKPVRELTVRELLDSASRLIETRFAGQPVTAAEIHAALGTSYLTLELGAEARDHLEAAFAAFREHRGPGAEPTLETAGKLIDLKYFLGELRGDLAPYEDALAAGERELGPGHPHVVQLRQQVAWGAFRLGQWVQAAAQLEGVLRAKEAAVPRDEGALAGVELGLGQIRTLLADYPGAETLLRNALARYQAAGEEMRAGFVRRGLGEVMLETGRYGEADVELAAALESARKWAVDERSGTFLTIRRDRARLWLEQGRAADAARELSDIVQTIERLQGPEMDQTATIRHPLAEAYQRLGRLDEAAAAIDKALASSERADGPDHPVSQLIRVGAADIWRERGRYAEAQAALKNFNPASPRLPPDHPGIAHFHRVSGLLALERGDAAAAQVALSEALRIYEGRYGTTHWRTRQARQELERATRRSTAAR